MGPRLMTHSVIGGFPLWLGSPILFSWRSGRPQSKTSLVRHRGGLDGGSRRHPFFQDASSLAAISFGYGVAFGVLKIAWIVLADVYLYDISVETGQFEIMKESVAGITPDRRLQVLLVAFCFGAFIEGAAGFGAPVAIACAFMSDSGWSPLTRSVEPDRKHRTVAWGAIGTPVHTLAAVTALPESDLNAMIGRILPFTAVIVAFWLVKVMVSWRETFEVLPAILVVGVFIRSHPVLLVKLRGQQSGRHHGRRGIDRLRPDFLAFLEAKEDLAFRL